MTAVMANATCSYIVSKYFAMFPDADDDGSGRSRAITKWKVCSQVPEDGRSLAEVSGVRAFSSTCGDWPSRPLREPRPRDAALYFSGRKRHAPSCSAQTGWPMNASSSTMSSNFWWHMAECGQRRPARNSAE